MSQRAVSHALAGASHESDGAPARSAPSSAGRISHKDPRVTRFPWQERNGRFSALKAACFGALFFFAGVWTGGGAGAASGTGGASAGACPQ